MPEMTFATADGEMGGYLALPGSTPAATILVIQEIFGVNEVMRDICDGFASQGYVAACPDLFWRLEPGVQLTDKTEAEWQRAFDFFGRFDVDKGVNDLKAALATLRQHPASNGKVGTVGFCLGGKMAYLMATRSDADCNVGYYGVQIDSLLGEADKIAKPLLLHVPTEDQFVPPEAQAAMREGLAERPLVDFQAYEGNDHAFARIGGEHFDANAAKLANGRTADFFKQHLGG